jgi:hypothetical protein
MFGVTVWEIYTLGATPYFGCQSADIPSLVQRGHRLPKPSQCSEHTYVLARLCWQLKAPERPTFEELVELMAHVAQDNLLTPEADPDGGTVSSMLLHRQGHRRFASVAWLFDGAVVLLTVSRSGSVLPGLVG